jgi:hypothetical protein
MLMYRKLANDCNGALLNFELSLGRETVSGGS